MQEHKNSSILYGQNSLEKRPSEKPLRTNRSENAFKQTRMNLQKLNKNSETES